MSQAKSTGPLLQRLFLLIPESIGNNSFKMETELSEWSETFGHLVKSTP